jgi:hypothetical protein
MAMPATFNVSQDGSGRSRLRRLISLDGHALNLVLVTLAALGATYVAMCMKAVAIGSATYGYADFHALWVSGVLAHDGTPLVNYDSAALHAKQVLFGIDAHRENPFPYPPTFLLLLSPLGSLPLTVAFWAFMGASACLFVLAMVAGRIGDYRWWIAAIAAPASGITIVSGQSGFLSAALMIGGLRLMGTRPLLAGMLFGLLTFKPQLGVLVPVALLAAGLWRVAAAACITALAGIVVSGLVFGFAVWPAWAHQMADYADGYEVVVDLMPTLYANVRGTAAGPLAALVVQLIASVAVGAVVWRAFRSGVTERGMSLVAVGAFLATPHAFNYDMPMTAAAIGSFVVARMGAPRVSVFALAAAAAVFVTPLAILATKGAMMPWTWVPLAAFFVVIARDDAGRADPLSQRL